MEERKQKEIEYYDKQAQRWLAQIPDKRWQGDFEGFNPDLLSSYRFCYKLLEKYCQGKTILDYGCGNGVHSISLAKWGTKVIGVDLSNPSLQIARERAEKAGVSEKIQFLLMDCENMQFPDNSFDVIFDGGTFSSLDIKKALPELARVLRPDGFLIGIETLGHNPLANSKRKFNKRKGKRTGWAVDHIVQLKDFKYAQSHFDKMEVHFFHLISWLAFPLLKSPGSRPLLKLLEIGDRMLLKIPFLRKYAFKTVFVFSQPKND